MFFFVFFNVHNWSQLHICQVSTISSMDCIHIIYMHTHENIHPQLIHDYINTRGKRNIRGAERHVRMEFGCPRTCHLLHLPHDLRLREVVMMIMVAIMMVMAWRSKVPDTCRFDFLLGCAHSTLADDFGLWVPMVPAIFHDIWESHLLHFTMVWSLHLLPDSPVLAGVTNKQQLFGSKSCAFEHGSYHIPSMAYGEHD